MDRGHRGTVGFHPGSGRRVRWVRSSRWPRLSLLSASSLRTSRTVRGRFNPVGLSGQRSPRALRIRGGGTPHRRPPLRQRRGSSACLRSLRVSVRDTTRPGVDQTCGRGLGRPFPGVEAAWPFGRKHHGDLASNDLRGDVLADAGDLDGLAVSHLPTARPL